MVTKKIFLITGPPGNGRDEYIQNALPQIEKDVTIGYYHVFEYMQRMAPSFGISNLTRENVFQISKNQLENIRNLAFDKVYEEINNSNNEIEIISTPAIFKVRPWADYLTGRVEGLTISHIEKLNPNYIIVFIDDLLRVRENMKNDPLWSRKADINLKNLAEWRHSSIEIIQGYFERYSSKVNWIMFAKEHSIDTFVDIILNRKPKIYISYHITGHENFAELDRFIKKLSEYFVCIDPYTIKDWNIVKKYDDAIQNEIHNNINIVVEYRNGKQTFQDIPLSEIEEAIDLIRTQIVYRDLHLISSVNATIVYHIHDEPSYGVMTEIIHSATQVSRPVYVLYPFKKRPSPFFEHYIERDKMIHGDKSIEELENELITKLKSDYENWSTWSPSN